MSEMSSQQILARVRQMVPPMLGKFHKGESTTTKMKETNETNKTKDQC